jgi:hypothetical protein
MQKGSRALWKNGEERRKIGNPCSATIDSNYYSYCYRRQQRHNALWRCHIRHMHKGRWFTMTAYDSEKECMMADGGNLYKDIGAPQWIIIDWNQGIIDIRTTTSDDDDFFCVGIVLALPEGSGVF